MKPGGRNLVRPQYKRKEKVFVKVRKLKVAVVGQGGLSFLCIFFVFFLSELKLNDYYDNV